MLPETFQILEQNDEQLIVPARGIGNDAWRDWEYRWCRSLHIGPDEHIISVGLPKFVNLNEGFDRYKVTEDDVLKHAGKGLWATLKVDGSMLIRFVQDGKVKFRTRGSFGVFLDNAFEVDEFCKEHPLLVDPSYHPEESLLFEWVSPLNPIVIRYDQPQLFLIGAVRYRKDCIWSDADLELYKLKELKVVSGEMNIPLPDFYPLNKPEDVNKLIRDLKSEKEIEGFVLRFNDEQEMVKVKSDHYFILHALKSNLTTVKLVELWQSWNGPDFNSFAEKFQNVYDYECWVWAMPVVSSMYDGVSEVNRIIAHVKEFVESSRALSRKDFALSAQSRFNQYRLSLCFMFWDHKPASPEIVKKLVLQNCKQVEKRMFSAEEDDS